MILKPDYPILEFSETTQWRAWLDEHHTDADGVWLKFYKKASGIPTMNRAEVLDHALCYGWIDGQAQSGDDDVSFYQKFTPRRARSIWSKRNIEHVERLTAAELMTPAGIAEVERAQADGRWAQAYDAPSNMTVPEDFIKVVRADKKLSAFYDTLNKSNLYSIGFKLQTAKKPETRQRRFDKLIEELKNGIKPSV